ncbi:type II toxin-antitoxin system ParD family antitoxin [Microbacterium sp. 179-I 3D4 NHS]|uniref:ribbon-helix-helix domain-containing protein n=1 Tax=Microbacterium sp. 179-I 3D4 NHS TaxID=3142381 RepID=UPI0039A0268E
MSTMNISLPESMKDFVEEQVEARGFGTSSEFVRDLIRTEQDRTALRALVVDGMRSGPGSELDDDYFERLRQRVRSNETPAE